MTCEASWDRRTAFKTGSMRWPGNDASDLVRQQRCSRGCQDRHVFVELLDLENDEIPGRKSELRVAKRLTRTETEQSVPRTTMCNISFCDVDSKVDQFFQPTLYIIVIVLGLPTNCMALWAAYMQVRTCA